MQFRKLYKRWEAMLGRPFERYSGLVCTYPWYVLILCVVCNCLLGLGILRIQIETDTETLYTPEYSQSKSDRAVIQNIFSDKSGTNFYAKSITDKNKFADVIIQIKDGYSILTTTYLNEIERIYSFINTTVAVTKQGVAYGLSDVCALRTGNCVVEGDIVFSTPFRSAMTSNNITYPVYNMNYIGGMLGSAQSSAGILTSAKMVLLRFCLRQNTATAKELSGLWEDKFIEVFRTFSSSLVDVAYSASDSIDEELNTNVAGDIIYFALTIALMLLYAGFATSGGNCVSDRQNLGRAGVFATCLSILGSFGLVSAAGVKFVSIVGILPFLIIGIGLDDMFVLISCLADVPVKSSIEDRIKNTMTSGGVAITITSVTNFLAFAIGSSASFISVKNFCLYAGVAVLFCYINQLTFFVPCMVINERRVSTNGHCGTCQPIKTREELRRNGKSHVFAFCCGGEAPKSRADNESPLEKYPKLLFQKIVAIWPGRIAVIVIFLGYTVAFSFGIFHFKRGLLISNLVAEDSYVYTYTKLLEDSFSDVYTIGFTVTSTQFYSDSNTQNQVAAILANARANSLINPAIIFDWLSDYKSSGSYSSANESSFIAGLQTFLLTRTDHANDVIINNAGTSIVASRFYVLTNGMSNSEQKDKVMRSMREIAEKSSFPVVCFSWPFVFFDEYAASFSITFTTVGAAIAAMFVVTIVFMPHPLLVACVSGTMATICAGMLGCMYYWDLALSSITMIEIVMSIGFSVDFSTHICHAYITVNGSTRTERVHNALERSGGPIINAALSSLVGIVALAFSSSYIFRSFFKLMFLVLTFGLAHALLLLPVVFSFVGPVTDATSENDVLATDRTRNKVAPGNTISEENKDEGSPRRKRGMSETNILAENTQGQGLQASVKEDSISVMSL